MRASGRTYRMLLKAQLAMSEGKNVFVVVPQDGYCNNLFRQTVKLVAGYVPDEQLDLDFKKKVIQIKGVNGCIVFMTERNYTIYLNNPSVKIHTVLRDDQSGGDRRQPYIPDYQVKI